MFNNLSLPLLMLVFVGVAVVVWVAGVQLSNNIDVLASRLGLGEALGGLLLLSIASNLPEIAIVCSAAFHGDLALVLEGGLVIALLRWPSPAAGCRPICWWPGSRPARS